MLSFFFISFVLMAIAARCRPTIKRILFHSHAESEEYAIAYLHKKGYGAIVANAKLN